MRHSIKASFDPDKPLDSRASPFMRDLHQDMIQRVMDAGEVDLNFLIEQIAFFHAATEQGFSLALVGPDEGREMARNGEVDEFYSYYNHRHERLGEEKKFWDEAKREMDLMGVYDG